MQATPVLYKRIGKQNRVATRVVIMVGPYRSAGTAHKGIPEKSSAHVGGNPTMPTRPSGARCHRGSAASRPVEVATFRCSLVSSAKSSVRPSTCHRRAARTACGKLTQCITTRRCFRHSGARTQEDERLE